PEYVFDCAAKVGGIKANMDAPAEFLYLNLQIQNNVFEAARLSGVKKLLFVGSSCIYPKQAECPIREESLLTGPFEPTNEGYAIAKVAGVRMCQYYRKQYGSNYIAAIPTNLYGPGDHYDLNKSHLLPALIRKTHEAKLAGRDSIEVWGSGKPRREFMTSDDCADALVFLMRKYEGAEPINVGTGVDHTILELAETVARVLGARVSFKLDATKPDGMMRKVVDVSRLTELGWKSRIALEDGIRTAYEDFLKGHKA
ncbi:MAG: GDP-L-fucose synthase, partial [Deltaproteobacteria bacterium]|nr:GDP-L-fucose synthase [Deltaproteobacteria bacterium]